MLIGPPLCGIKETSRDMLLLLGLLSKEGSKQKINSGAIAFQLMIDVVSIRAPLNPKTIYSLLVLKPLKCGNKSSHLVIWV